MDSECKRRICIFRAF